LLLSSLLVALLIGGTEADNAGPRASSAFTAAAVLNRDFPGRDISYLLLELGEGTGTVGASRWDHPGDAIPVGSLVKPFTALAYAESHSFRFPQHICTPGSCWLPRGHGRVGIVQATAVSCNSYFTSLAGDVTANEVAGVARRFGLSGPPADVAPEGLVGKDGAWRESPDAIAHAYAELLRRHMQPGIRELVDGMAAAARNGTAAGIARAVPHLPTLAKTGTGPCTHVPRAVGDGFVVVAWPADAPRYLLLVRLHGRSGALAAELAGRMLHALEPLS
jgi:cell division protein FtsI/penicillin-binding protein 2